MFNNLVESSTHTADLKRKSSFLLATVLAYMLLLMAAGVGSIYAYEAHVDNQSLELTALVTMLPAAAAPPQTSPDQPAHRQPPRTTTNRDETARVPMRTVNQSDVDDMRVTPDKIGVAGNNIPPMLPNAQIGPRNIDVGGLVGPHGSGVGTGTPGGANGSGTGGTEMTRETPPPIPKVETKPPKTNVIRSLGVIESKVLHKAVPPYPELAKRAHISGKVTVQILLDEQGRVISARATDGHSLLRGAAERAAFQTRFSPTFLSNEAVKVSGIITFNFILQ